MFQGSWVDFLQVWFAQASWIKLTNTVRKGNNATKQGWQISILQ